VAEAVAEVLGVRDDAGPAQSPVDRLVGVLRAARPVLVLDNCEHVIDQVAKLAESLLRAVPGLRVLATSRAPLGISGEVLCAVPPLELPDPAALDGPASGLLRYGAVRLFVTRAGAAAPGFTLDEGNAGAVVTICRRLDGIPLALELAATRVRALGVRELAVRLDDRFRLLAGGIRDAPARQRTLRAVIDWSWELLTGPERAVLRRLAIHAGGCTLAAAEAVCAGDGVDAADVLGLLADLVDRSLVVMADRPGGVRYRLLESVAAYGLDRLREAGEFERVLDRHGRYYTAFAETAAPYLRTRDQCEWLSCLDAEAANIRAALDGAVRRDAAGLALRLVDAMAWYWVLRGRLSDGHQALTSALAARGPAPDAVRARAMAWHLGVAHRSGAPIDRAASFAAVLRHRDGADDPAGRAAADWFLAYALLNTGDPAVADLADRALTGFRALGDRWGVAAALGVRSARALLRGDLAGARHDGERSAALFGELGDRWGQVQATATLGALAEIAGDYAGAAALHGDGLRMAGELGLWPEVSYRFSLLGRLALLGGDHTGARELHGRAMRLAAEHSYTFGVVFAEIGLGLGARREGLPDVAESHLRNVLDWYRRVAPEPGNALVLAELGFIAEQRGDAGAALALHLDGYTAAARLGDPRAVALALEGLAGVRLLMGGADRAAELLGAAAVARESAGAPLPRAERGDVDRIAGGARAALGEEEFTARFEHGGTLTPGEAVRALG
jgi:predicted ATPase